MIQENYLSVKDRVRQACVRAGRDEKEVLLIAVSKTRTYDEIHEAAKAGAKVFGENKPQELRDKADALNKDYEWHMIGHLQTNKIKYIIERASLIHSIDSYKLAEAVDKEAEKRQMTASILVQVNIAKEDSKFGLDVEETEILIRQIAQLKHVKIKGLMTVPPFVENPEDNRVHFRNMRQLFIDIKHKNIDNVDMNELSMGMTGDFEVAIEEGATMVRVGTGIFGERDYSI
ncbi:MAG: YggS family pyridoxal phosphate-dependent enzyme [Lachnospiraceae bacterium]|nr:YggS family pyridoxal phosphate-dependent enzyme [Lachnospiraceae bacterium]